jgi:hypothetical protein
MCAYLFEPRRYVSDNEFAYFYVYDASDKHVGVLNRPALLNQWVFWHSYTLEPNELNSARLASENHLSSLGVRMQGALNTKPWTGKDFSPASKTELY